MSYRADKLVIDKWTDRQTHRRRQRQYHRRPKLASGKKARFLVFHLAGDAKVFYHGLSQQEKADYDTLKQKLQENFLPTASDIQAAKLAFYTRKQGPYESLRDFVHQAEIAARQLGLMPADQVNAIISNCRPAIRCLVRAQTFVSLKELSKFPLTQEDFEEELHHPTLQAIMDKLDTFQHTQERPQTVKFAVAVTDVPQQRDYHQSRHHNREYPQQRQRSRSRPKYNPNDENACCKCGIINCKGDYRCYARDKVCYRCDRKGHIKPLYKSKFVGKK